MNMTRRFMLAAAIAIPVTGTILRPALAKEPEVFAPGGVAISGYDPVAYFTQGRAVPGKPEYALMWRGATWYFASADAMETFEMNPAGFAPQYGGYCAYAVAKGGLAPTEPDAFTVDGGRLYLNFSTEVRTLWRKDIPGYVTEANSHWPAVLQEK